MTTLTKEQELKSLFKGKRKRHEKAPKIVLCNPFKKYWPLVNEEDAEEIENLLKSLLPPLFKVTQNPKIPWKKLIKLPKEIRKARIEELKQRNTIPDELQCHRNHVKLGLNSVSRAIQHSRITTCLLAGDIEPTIIIEHIITLASTREIPLIIVPKLKNIMFKNIGFSCTAIGILVNETNQYFKSLNEGILKISLQFPLPLNYGCLLRRSQNFVKKKKKITHDDNLKKMISNKSDNVDSCLEVKSSECKTSVNIKNEQINSTFDFIPINVEQTSVNTPITSNEILYIHPSFKRMLFNPNKAKNKKKKKNK